MNVLKVKTADASGWNGLWGPLGIETLRSPDEARRAMMLEWLVGPVRD